MNLSEILAIGAKKFARILKADDTGDLVFIPENKTGADAERINNTGVTSVANAAARKNAATYDLISVGVTKVIQADMPGVLWNLVAEDVTLDASWIGVPITTTELATVAGTGDYSDLTDAPFTFYAPSSEWRFDTLSAGLNMMGSTIGLDSDLNNGIYYDGNGMTLYSLTDVSITNDLYVNQDLMLYGVMFDTYGYSILDSSRTLYDEFGGPQIYFGTSGIVMSQLPSSDPGIQGALFLVDDGTEYSLKVSKGP